MLRCRFLAWILTACALFELGRYEETFDVNYQIINISNEAEEKKAIDKKRPQHRNIWISEISSATDRIYSIYILYYYIYYNIYNNINNRALFYGTIGQSSI